MHLKLYACVLTNSGVYEYTVRESGVQSRIARYLYDKPEYKIE